MERIQKILAQGGIASRRAAERLITEGRVRVNGRVVTELGTKADPRNDRVEVDGKRVVAEHHVYIAIHKPRGVVATMSDPEGRPTIREIVANVGVRVFPVGRLDFATSGVLLATNDGEMSDGLLHPKKAVPKTYIVKVKGKMTSDDLDHWRQGVHLEDGITLPAEAKVVRFEGDKTWFELTIREGRNQQIRRMGEATRFPVMRLARLSFAQITAEHLRPGQWRHLTREELVQLKKTYGVPKSIPSAPEGAPLPERRMRAPERRPQRPNDRGARPAASGAATNPRGPRGERFTSRDRVRDRGPSQEQQASGDRSTGGARAPRGVGIERRPHPNAGVDRAPRPTSREGTGPSRGGSARPDSGTKPARPDFSRGRGGPARPTGPSGDRKGRGAK